MVKSEKGCRKMHNSVGNNGGGPSCIQIDITYPSIRKEGGRTEQSNGNSAAAIDCQNFFEDPVRPMEILELPEDLMMHILYRLRVKCVCKAWRGLVEDTDFIAKHLNNGTLNNKENSDLLVTYYIYNFSREYYLMDYRGAGELFWITARLPGEDFNGYGMVLRVGTVACCNGIICLYFGGRKYIRDLALWNPATRQLRNIETNWDYFVRGVGFGFEVKTNNYKVVIIYDAYRREDDYSAGVEVYSLREDTWRKVGASISSCAIFDQVTGTYLNGFYYWVVTLGNEMNETILSFDMSCEVFQKISFPPDVPITDLPLFFRISALNDSITLFCYDYGRNDMFRVWLLNELSSSSWTKLHHIENQVSRIPRDQYFYPLGYLNKGELCLGSSGGVLISCDPATLETKRLPRSGKDQYAGPLSFQDSYKGVRVSDFVHYKESLVPINHPKMG